jgi:hypothetical protein
MEFFGRNQRKAFLQVKPHLIAKTTDRSGAGTIGFFYAFIQYMLKQV